MKTLTFTQTLLIASLAFNLMQGCSKPEQPQNEPAAAQKAEAPAAEAKEAPKAAEPNEAPKVEAKEAPAEPPKNPEDEGLIAALATEWYIDSDHGPMKGDESDFEKVKARLAAGANVNAKTSEGVTALMRAVFEGNQDALKMLLEAKADVNAADNEGKTALMIAASEHFEEGLKALLEAKADVNAKDKLGRTALMHAVSNVAVSNRDSSETQATLKRLLDAGADVNAKDDEGRNVFCWLFSYSKEEERGGMDNQEFVKERLPNIADTVNTLIAAKADPNAKDKQGNTVAHYAAREGFEAEMKALLKAGTDFNAKNDKGQTAWFFATQGANGDAINFLRSAKVDVNAKDNQGRTALNALFSGLLSEEEQVAYYVQKADFFPGDVPRSLEKIRIAAMTDALIKAKADVNLKDDEGRTALSKVYGYFSEILADDQEDLTEAEVQLTKALIKAKADVKAADNKGNTILMYAAQNGKPEAVKALLAAKPDVKAKNAEGKSALDLASSDEIKALLRKAGAK